MVNVSRMKNKTVSAFINTLRSQGSKDNYYSVLKSFFEHIKPELKEVPDKLDHYTINPEKVHAIDEVSLEYVRDPEVKTMTGEVDYEEDLRRFRDEVLGDHAKSTKKYKFRVILRYLGVNQIEFDKGFTKNMLGRGKPVTAIVEKIPTPTQLDMMLDRIDPAGRAAIQLMAKAGMRPEEVLESKLTNLELDFVAEYVDSDTGREMSVPIAKLNIPMAKDEQPRITLLIKEVEDELRTWLEKRPEYIKDLKEKHLYRDKDPDASKIFPFGVATLRSMWNTTLKKCDLAEREDLTLRRRHVYRLHNLRKFFRTYGSWQNPDVAEALMGHQEGIEKIYDRKDKAIELLVKGIRQAEPRLTSRRLRVYDIEDVRTENERLRLETSQLYEKLIEVEKQVEKMAPAYEMVLEMIDRERKWEKLRQEAEGI